MAEIPRREAYESTRRRFARDMPQVPAEKRDEIARKAHIRRDQRRAAVGKGPKPPEV